MMGDTHIQSITGHLFFPLPLHLALWKFNHVNLFGTYLVLGPMLSTRNPGIIESLVREEYKTEN